MPDEGLTKQLWRTLNAVQARRIKLVIALYVRSSAGDYCTVTLLARLRGLSTSQPRETAM